ncbi:MAG: DNA repair protein RadC [Flavobacteriales bacterium]|jgi:DNA repair protein RadC|nr:DNA repair protein RadC [Flavobacteriales bacterium]MCL4856268.1 DNA repair protein RadC [Flavobacteriales bacterium]
MQPEKLNIKSWAEEDRPREKLLLKGKNALSDAELIAILIGSGNKTETAVELSKRILASVNNDLNQLAKLNLTDLMQFNGIGEAKAISIAAALELGRRRKESTEEKKIKISSSKNAYEAISDVLSDLPHEEFWVLYLNRKNEVIKRENISKGGVTGTVADGKIIFKNAINALASAVVLCHNHPSGNLNPSQADIELTKKMKGIGVLMDTPVIDHIIVGNNNYFSFADENLL